MLSACPATHEVPITRPGNSVVPVLGAWQTCASACPSACAMARAAQRGFLPRLTASEFSTPGPSPGHGGTVADSHRASGSSGDTGTTSPPHRAPRPAAGSAGSETRDAGRHSDTGSGPARLFPRRIPTPRHTPESGSAIRDGLPPWQPGSSRCVDSPVARPRCPKSPAVSSPVGAWSARRCSGPRPSCSRVPPIPASGTVAAHQFFSEIMRKIQHFRMLLMAASLSMVMGYSKNDA